MTSLAGTVGVLNELVLKQSVLLMTLLLCSVSINISKESLSFFTFGFVIFVLLFCFLELHQRYFIFPLLPFVLPNMKLILFTFN